MTVATAPGAVLDIGAALRQVIRHGPESTPGKERFSKALGFAGWADLLFCISSSGLAGESLEAWLDFQPTKENLLAISPELRRLQAAGDTP